MVRWFTVRIPVVQHILSIFFQFFLIFLFFLLFIVFGRWWRGKEMTSKVGSMYVRVKRGNQTVFLHVEPTDSFAVVKEKLGKVRHR